MDTSDWPLLSETGPLSGGLPLPLNPSSGDRRQCSSSCQIDPVVGSFNGGEDANIHYENHGVAEDQSYINKTSNPMRGNRSRNAPGKSEVRKLSGGEAKLEVVFQKLNDAKKGIPDDGHRGWKKYGNKSIQNSNHCRGYYKCSVKECRAKKMVQPTDKDPTIFEVTYVGKHSCSSTGQRRSRSTRTAACNPAPVEAHEPSGRAQSPVAKDDDWKNKRGGMELEEDSILTGSNSMTEGSIKEDGWSGIIPGSSTCKRGRSNNVEDDKASLDNYSYLHTMTTSTTTTASEEQEQAGDAGDASMDTYLHQSSRHHQAVYSFQEPLLWHDFDIDTSLSTGHKSVSMDSDSP